LKVAILVPTRSGVSGGLVKHLAEVVPRWLKCNHIKRISIIATEGIHSNIEKLGVDVNHVSRNDYRTGFRKMGELVEAGAYDVVLCTTARPVRLGGCPVVTMVRNIEPLQKPTYKMSLTWRIRLWVLRHEHALACRQATRILAVSSHVKNEVCQRFRVRQDKVDVVYHGFNSDEGNEPRKFTLDTPNDFIFSAGSIVPYRGYEDIIRALAVLRSSGSKPFCAVLAGSNSGNAKSYEQSLKKMAKSLKVEDSIVWAGQLQRDEMSWCFQNASIFIQTSRAEACPNTVLEAMGHGCVTISCDHPPMPEFFKDTAAYYSPGDYATLAQLIKKTHELSKFEAESRRSDSMQRASFFSWDATAERTLNVLERAIKDYSKR